MAKMSCILSVDIGTTSTKTCLYRVDEKISLLGSAMEEYSLTVTPGGGVEQDPEDWLKALAKTTKAVMADTGVDPEDLEGISFSSQMQGLILTDAKGRPVRRAMSYMDQRAVAQKKAFGRGVTIEGIPVGTLFAGIKITGIAPTSVKDPVWKYQWVRECEPENFRKVRWWFDVKDFIIFRLTGRATATRDSAGATTLFDNRPGRYRWSVPLCRLYGVDAAHLPEIIESHQEAGKLLPGPAEELGLNEGIPVFGGGGDASMLGIGAGAVREGDTHIYMGTSGWVSQVTSRRKLDLKHKIASITCAVPDRYHYFCEQETSGKCLEWVRDHLALDEIGIYLDKVSVTEDSESVYRSLFEYLDQVVEATPPGCGGLLFTPWLHGSRSPFEDPNVRGIFFNLGLTTGKSEMIRAVVEGLAYSTRWMLESIETKLPCRGPIRFVGGGALSPVTARIMADITERELEVPEEPHNAGALGAAVTAALGLGLIGSFDEVPRRISVKARYTPEHRYREVYDRNYRVFKRLYLNNKRLFAALNGECV